VLVLASTLQAGANPGSGTLAPTYAAICKVELLCRVAEYLHVEVDEECPDHVLVGLADAIPEAVLPLDDLIPLRLGRRCLFMGQAVRQQPLHGACLRRWGGA
jgi:hypothetical protein